MANIVMKDLPENVELDRAAMQAIAGGARSRGHQSLPRRSSFRGTPGRAGEAGYRPLIPAGSRPPVPAGRPPR